MIEKMRSFPWEWFSKWPIISLIIQTLIKTIETTPQKDLIKSFQILLFVSNDPPLTLVSNISNPSPYFPNSSQKPNAVIS
jgi:hypothetical protein